MLRPISLLPFLFLMFDRVSILDHFAFKVFLQHVGIGGTDSFVVILFQIDNFETELFVKFNSTFVVDLDMSTRERIIEGGKATR